MHSNSNQDLPNKSEIISLIEENEYEAALSATLLLVEAYQLLNLRNELTLLKAKWNSYESDLRSGTVSYGILTQTKMQLSKALLSLLDELPAPDSATTSTKLAPGPIANHRIGEDTFKRQVFFMMFMAKIIVLAFLVFHYSTGGFSRPQLLATLGVMLPVFSAYFTVIVKDQLKNIYVNQAESKPKYIKHTIRIVTYTLIPLYTISLAAIIHQKARGSFGQNMEEFFLYLGLIETILGLYVGQLINALFKTIHD